MTTTAERTSRLSAYRDRLRTMTNRQLITEASRDPSRRGGAGLMTAYDWARASACFGLDEPGCTYLPYGVTLTPTPSTCLARSAACTRPPQH